MLDFGHAAADRGLRVLIAGAGGAAHLPGMLAAATTLPVIGVPVSLANLSGLDSLLSIVQMPRGVPVATVAIDGARNAGLLAVRILALADDRLRQGSSTTFARGAGRQQARSQNEAIVTALAERLGHPAGARLLIVHADELGFCHAANVGVYDSLRDGLATSASLMVPGPWAREAAARYRGEDVGVQLTVNAEHELYRWGPITQSPSLLGGDGGFPRTMEDVWDHADLDEVRRECRAQIERAIVWGFDVSHLSTHLDTLQLRPEFFDVCLELAAEFDLPLRLLGHGAAQLLGLPRPRAGRRRRRDLPRRDDHHRGRDAGPDIESLVAGLAPGVTELRLRPAVESAELRAVAADWEQRVADRRFLCEEPADPPPRPSSGPACGSSATALRTWPGRRMPSGGRGLNRARAGAGATAWSAPQAATRPPRRDRPPPRRPGRPGCERAGSRRRGGSAAWTSGGRPNHNRDVGRPGWRGRAAPRADVVAGDVDPGAGHGSSRLRCARATCRRTGIRDRARGTSRASPSHRSRGHTV